MNRLIIIGNGFDLAHNIKTSFNDFISDYFYNAIKIFREEDSYSDTLLEINKKPEFFNQKEKTLKIDNVYEITDSLLKASCIKFNSVLLSKLYSKASKLEWVDIEVEFFNALLDSKNSRDKFEISKVNEQLEYIKDKLIQYLTIQERQFNNSSIKDPLADSFREDIKKDDIVSITLEEDKKPDNLYFLNFNYTNTFKEYFDICDRHIKSSYNYIHGNLSKEFGNPIFGFGDEFDKKYLEFEDEKNNELFKHIKSFAYLQTKNYYELTRFVESGNFQIHIYGHSCGISDRTMLNQIFEHINCKSIKIFYHDNINDFVNKTYEISRHFKDKIMFRKKLVPFELSRKMPQPKFNN